MNDINLLPKNNISTLRQEQVVTVFRRISIVILAATAFTSVTIFILVLVSPLSQAQQEEKTLIAQLAVSSNKIARNVIIQERLTSITTILKTKNTYEKTISLLLHDLPESITVSKMDVTTNKVQITGTATSLEAANTFFNNLVLLQNKKEGIKSVLLKSFSLQGSNGTYYFTIETTLL
jgi:Tfp pilus assembly protein PilN